MLMHVHVHVHNNSTNTTHTLKGTHITSAIYTWSCTKPLSNVTNVIMYSQMAKNNHSNWISLPARMCYLVTTIHIYLVS